MTRQKKRNIVFMKIHKHKENNHTKTDNQKQYINSCVKERNANKKRGSKNENHNCEQITKQVLQNTLRQYPYQRINYGKLEQSFSMSYAVDFDSIETWLLISSLSV